MSNPEREIKRNRKEGQIPIYTDHANVTSGAFGFKITFGSILEATEERLEVDDLVTVGMSAEHAFALMKLLGEHLEGYGKNVGPIRVQAAQGTDDGPD